MKKKAAARAAPGRAAGRARGGKARASTAAPAPPAATTIAAPANDAFFLKLDASCTLRETADLQFSLVVATGDPVVVDGSAVERVDTAGLQLLVALVRRQQQSGRRLEWKATSPELLKCGERLGLLEALGLPAGTEAAP